jgi:hypothetical protein
MKIRTGNYEKVQGLRYYIEITGTREEIENLIKVLKCDNIDLYKETSFSIYPDLIFYYSFSREKIEKIENWIEAFIKKYRQSMDILEKIKNDSIIDIKKILNKYGNISVIEIKLKSGKILEFRDEYANDIVITLI